MGRYGLHRRVAAIRKQFGSIENERRTVGVVGQNPAPLPYGVREVLRREGRGLRISVVRAVRTGVDPEDGQQRVPNREAQVHRRPGPVAHDAEPAVAGLHRRRGEQHLASQQFQREFEIEFAIHLVQRGECPGGALLNPFFKQFLVLAGLFRPGGTLFLRPPLPKVRKGRCRRCAAQQHAQRRQSQQQIVSHSVIGSFGFIAVPPRSRPKAL